MADSPDGDQKTEPPSAKRRREAAARGEVLQSRELGTLLVIGAATGWLVLAAPDLGRAAMAAMRAGLRVTIGGDDVAAGGALTRLAAPLARPLLGFAVVAMLGGVAGPLLTSVRFSLSSVAPKASRIDPVAGLARMFSLRALVELLKALIKFALLAAAAALVFRTQLYGLRELGALDPMAAAARLGSAMAVLMATLTLALLAIAGVDLPVQWTRYIAKLRMTRQEVKDEAKESEGSPETRGAIRRAQRAAARSGLRPAMAAATVVVVNPEHFAVALRYRPGTDATPVVVAKGRAVIAAAIRDLASEAGVPVLRYPQLTRSIYFTARVGQPIAEDLYAAVAAVLAFVFNLDRAAAGDPPEVEIPEALRFNSAGRLDAFNVPEVPTLEG